MSTSPYDLDFDYLAAEDALVERIRAEVPGLVRVDSEASVASVQSGQLATPSALVLWSHDKPDESADPFSPQRVEQTWLVCLVVRVAGDKSGTRARAEAGPFIAKVVRAIRGWEPHDGFEPFRFTENVQPQLAPGGVLYVPIPFKTAFVL